MDYELAYRYGVPSRLDEYAGLALATSGGSTPEGEAACPYFFSGFMERPDVVAAGLLAVARVARTRFYVPPGMVVAPGGGLTRIGMLDPVVTNTAEGLRFESFSVCCGVYAQARRGGLGPGRRSLCGRRDQRGREPAAARRPGVAASGGTPALGRG